MNNQPTILFLFNVPTDLALLNYPDVFVTVKSEMYDDGTHSVKFLDIDTYLATRVKDWLKLYVLVDKVCEQKWAEQLRLDHSLEEYKSEVAVIENEPSFDQFTETYFSQLQNIS